MYFCVRAKSEIINYLAKISHLSSFHFQIQKFLIVTTPTPTSSTNDISSLRLNLISKFFFFKFPKVPFQAFILGDRYIYIVILESSTNQSNERVYF